MTGVEMRPDISAIVVSWNTRDLLVRCLAALDRHRASGRTMEIIVVDNGSTDGTAELVRRERADVRLIANPDNVGYTRANNQGIAAARGRYLLLINSDAFLEPLALERMLEDIETDPRAAIVGPRLVFGDGSWQRWTAGRAPSLRSAASHYLFLERIAPRSRLFGGVFLGDDTRVARTVDWVSSACLLARADAIAEVGGMDEQLFVYMDDVDLCQRLRDRGWKIRYVPAAQVVHLMGGGMGGIASAAALRSFNAYFSRRHGRVALAALRALQLAGFSMRAAAFGAAALLRREPALRARAGAHWRSLRLVIGGAR